MKYYIIIILSLFCILFSGCPDEDYGVTTIIIKNNSNDTIGYYFSIKNESRSNYDSLLPLSKPDFDIWKNYWVLKPHKVFTHTLNSDDMLSFLYERDLFYYFFNYDSVTILPWSQIREKRIYMKRLIINTKHDFDSCNYEITYP